jgi:hypothetical protein
VPVSDEHLWELTAEFLAEGLAAGEQVVYGENGTTDAVLGRLVDDGVPVLPLMDRGQLVVLPGDAMRGLGAASAGEVLTALDTVVTGGLATFPGVRLVGEASTGMRSGDGAAMIEYESRLDEVLADRPARIACLYDRNRYSDAAIARLCAVHEHRVEPAPPVHDDDLVRITVPRPFVARVAGEVDHSNRPRIRAVLEAALDTALRSAEPPEEIELDLASLRFLDVGAAASVVRAARDFPAPHRLLLSGVRPGVLRVLDRCGAPFVDQLRVEPHPGPWVPGSDRDAGNAGGAG